MAHAVIAGLAIRQGDAIRLDPYRMPDLGSRLIGTCNGFDSARRAYLATLHAFRPTIPSFVGHRGLHELIQRGRGPQYFVGADRDTQLASCAMLGEVPRAPSSGRDDRHRTLRGFLLYDRGQASVYFLLLGF